VVLGTAARRRCGECTPWTLGRHRAYASTFFPLLQPTQVFVATIDLKNAVFNAEYEIDVTQVSPK
jgi:hypothetical protein